MSDLKPCPFCGDVPAILIGSEGEEAHCDDCHIWLPLERWNRLSAVRWSPEPVNKQDNAALLAEAREALDWALQDVKSNAEQFFAPDDPFWNDYRDARAVLAKLEKADG